MVSNKLFWYGCILAGLACVHNAKASEVVIIIDPLSPVFGSAVDAAKAVSVGFKDRYEESAAVIVKLADGGYVFSTVTTQQHDSFKLRVSFPRGTTLAAIVHSHPGDDALGHVFSPQDLNTADSLKLTSCIRFVSDGSFKCYFPGRTVKQSTTLAGAKFTVKTAIGDIV